MDTTQELYDPIVSLEMMNYIVLSAIGACLLIPLAYYFTRFFARFMASQLTLESDKIVVPVHDFAPESDPITILQIGEQTPDTPYDWAKEID